jgi:hypothetical protein
MVEDRSLSFWAYYRPVISRAFAEFKLGRDMLLGAALSAASVLLQVHWRLINPSDWKSQQWHWIGSVVIPFVAVMFVDALWRLVLAPWNLYTEMQDKHEAELSQIEAKRDGALAELEREKNRALQPDVALVWCWQTDRLARSVTEKVIGVENRSDKFVYNVQIAPVCLHQEMTFDRINEIQPHSMHLALARWNGRSSVSTNYVYYWSYEENEKEIVRRGWMFKKLHSRGLSDFFFKIPMKMTYEADGVKWESEFDCIVDVGDENLFEKRAGQRSESRPSDEHGQISRADSF